MGKLAIFMAIFNSYVKLPEGTHHWLGMPPMISGYPLISKHGLLEKKRHCVRWFSQLYLSFFFSQPHLMLTVAHFVYCLSFLPIPMMTPQKWSSLSTSPRWVCRIQTSPSWNPSPYPPPWALESWHHPPYEKITQIFIGRNKPFPSQKGGLSMALFCPHYFLFGSIWFHNCYMFSCASTLVNGSFIMI